MKKTLFKLESLGTELFDGFTKNEEWNGWSCPYFTFEQAQKVLKSFNQLAAVLSDTPGAYYDPDSDAFVFNVGGEKEAFASVIEDGQKYFPIGAFSWIWDEVENNIKRPTTEVR